MAFLKKVLFIEPRGGLQSTLALFLAVIEFVSACVPRKRRRRKPGAGPKQSADRLRHVGERGCQCADVNRAPVQEAPWMEVCSVYVTRCSGLACLTPIWNRVDRKVDRCFTDVHYL